MADFSSVSIWIKVCLLLIPLGGLLHLIGFASPYWINNNLGNQGLWKYCNKVIAQCYEQLESKYLPGWMRATQFFETVGLIAIGVAAVLLFLSLLLSVLRNKKVINIIIAIICFGAAGCIIFGVITYAAQDINRQLGLGWAFALCVVGGIIEGVAGALILVGTCRT